MVNTNRLPNPKTRTYKIILYLSIKIKQLIEQKKSYPWPKLERCPTCSGSRVWGHGYVLRYFDDYEEGLWLKRYRCVDCGAVHTVRPESHYRGFWASWRTILCSLIEKGIKNRWLKGVSRQRQQYWWKGFLRQASRQCNLQEEPLFSLIKLFSKNVILATHSLKYFEIKPPKVSTHLIFAVTTSLDYG